VVRVDGGIATNFAASLRQVTVRQRTLHGNMSQIFFRILATPIGLTGVGF
jgi:hypothetical protein